MILLCIMGLHMMPVLIVCEWICLSWSMDLQLWKRETGGFSMEEMWVGGDKCGEEIAMDIIWLSAEEWYRMEGIRWVL